MRRPAKLHPTDLRDQEWIARAAHFTAFCQRGPRDRRRSQHGTQAEAEEAGRALSADMGGKPALIYAVTPEGRSAFVKAVTPCTTPDAPKEGADMTEDPHTANALFAPTTAPPDDPLVVNGVRFPNAARAAEARRLVANRMKVPAALSKPLRTRKKPDATVKIADAADAQSIVAGVEAALPQLAKAWDRHPNNPANKAQVTAPPINAGKTAGKRAQALADAQAGIMPTPPDFSADTHRRYRTQLDLVVTMAEGGNLAGLKAETIKTTGSSGKALDRYRNLAVMALEAKAKS